MNKTKPRKRDRRTEYTCSSIKDAVLELLSQKDYGEITVTAICRQAQIGRGTFYLHYDNMRQVMDELFGDAMAQVKDMLVHVGFEPEEDGDCSYPLCRFLREQKKYQALFFSDSLRSEVMDAIYNSGKDHFLVNMRKRVDTSDEILLSLFYFQLNGCLALARKNVDCSNAKWDEIQCSVDRFLTHGLSALGAVDPMNGKGDNDMLRTVYGSKFAPDMSLGGLTGSPSPKYAGADISYKAPEVYGKVLDALLQPYAPAPNQGEIFQGIARILTEEEAELWLSVPEYSYDPEDPPALTVAQIAARVRPELAPKAGELIQSMLDKQFVFNMTRDGGEPAYMRTYMLWLCSTYTGREGSPLYEPMFNWFYNIIRGNSADMRPVPKSGNVMIALPNEVALTGDSALGKVPMNIQIPDDRTVIDYDKTSEVINNAWSWAVGECICRASTELHDDRDCDNPLDTCMLFDEDAELAIRLGWAEKRTKEEMHQLVRRCREYGMVQMTYNAEHPLSICNCCKCCCVFLNSLRRGENTIAGGSRFVAQRLDGCRTCGQCMKICPMDAIDITEQGARVNISRCIGCGLCVTKCNFGALQLTLRDPEDTSTGRACDYQKRAHI